jgi:hypothetical protein
MLFLRITYGHRDPSLANPSEAQGRSFIHNPKMISAAGYGDPSLVNPS